jgi:hypothetical protein
MLDFACAQCERNMQAAAFRLCLPPTPAAASLSSAAAAVSKNQLLNLGFARAREQPKLINPSS